MALIFLGHSQCSLCGAILEDGQPLVGFTAFLPVDDVLRRYSDSAMHEECFERWEHRDLMIEKYRRFTGEMHDDPEPARTRIAVIGAPEDRADLLMRLQDSRSLPFG